MVYVIAVLEVLLILPLASMLRGNPRYVQFAWFWIGVLLFAYSGFGPLGLSLISWPAYSGHTKGMELTVIDVLACALFLAQQGGERLPKPPFRFFMLAYFLSAVASIFFAQVPMAASFYSWQLLRMYFLYVVIYRASLDQKNIDSLIKGLAVGMLYEFWLVLFGKFVQGNYQPSGTFPHRNTLGWVTNLVALPMLSVYLGGRLSNLGKAAMLSGLAISALIASRATMGLAAIGAVLSYVFSVATGFVPRKAMIGVAGLVFAAIIIPVGLSSLNDRNVAQGDLSGGEFYDERAAFIDAASMMASDHPMGVGANNFVIVANTEGYFDRAGVAAVYGSRSAHVHNIYWLTAAELGYPGLVCLLLLLVVTVLKAFRAAWRYRGTSEGDYLAGLAIAMLVACIHSYFEWLMVTSIAQYFWAASLGLVAGLAARAAAGEDNDRTAEAEPER